MKKSGKTTFEPATERDDAAYLDFVTGTRAFTPVMDKKVFEDTEVAVEEYSKRTGHRPEGLLESFEAIDGVESLQARQAMAPGPVRRCSGPASSIPTRSGGPSCWPSSTAPTCPDPARLSTIRTIRFRSGTGATSTSNPAATRITRWPDTSYHYGTKCFLPGPQRLRRRSAKERCSMPQSRPTARSNGCYRLDAASVNR